MAKSGEWQEYFQQNEPPSNLAQVIESVGRFVGVHRLEDRKIVLVTSGGTMVPLESNTVRYLDNFSAGKRGASSAEYFLLEGYAVVFMHREKSLLPFARHLQHQNPLEWLTTESTDSGQVSLQLSMSPECRDKVSKQVIEYQKVKQENRLLFVTFTTVSDYLHLLKDIAKSFEPLGASAMLYLAAAVSDFYLPPPEMPEHKIQSSSVLSINMKQVPKLLSPLVKEWAPNAFTVSFKLETDKNLLIQKARRAIEIYRHQVVIANQLDTRRSMVVMVTQTDETPICMTDAELSEGRDIEEKIVTCLIDKHDLFITPS